MPGTPIGIINTGYVIVVIKKGETLAGLYIFCGLLIISVVVTIVLKVRWSRLERAEQTRRAIRLEEEIRRSKELKSQSS